jgi:hypothetical protein
MVLNKHGFNLVKSFGARAFYKGVLRRGVETFANFIDAIISLSFSFPADYFCLFEM